MSKESEPLFKNAAEVAEKMARAAELWGESDLLRGITLREIIPLAEGMAALAREIEELKAIQAN